MSLASSCCDKWFLERRYIPNGLWILFYADSRPTPSRVSLSKIGENRGPEDGYWLILSVCGSRINKPEMLGFSGQRDVEVLITALLTTHTINFNHPFLLHDSV